MRGKGCDCDGGGVYDAFLEMFWIIFRQVLSDIDIFWIAPLNLIDFNSEPLDLVDFEPKPLNYEDFDSRPLDLVVFEF